MNKTIFVIGAGASYEAGLPTGNELKTSISSLLDIYFERDGSLVRGDHKIVEALRRHAKNNGGDDNITNYQKEAWHIVRALPQVNSIDNLLDTQRDNEIIALCGKLGIVRSILKAEGHSTLSRLDNREEFNFNTLEDTWYIPFFKLLTANCSKKDLKKRLSSVEFIIFNYDRCFEHYMFHALKNCYRLSQDETIDLLSYINVYHPYGSVGDLPWTNNVSGVEFGYEPIGGELLEIADKIKTFTEGTDPKSSEILKIRTSLGAAKKLVFLGFAFHKLNMELLTPIFGPNMFQAHCFATANGISGSDKKIIQNEIRTMYKGNIDINMTHLECRFFFDEYWRGLNFQ